EWVHVQLHQQKGMISLSPPTICNSAGDSIEQKISLADRFGLQINFYGFSQQEYLKTVQYWLNEYKWQQRETWETIQLKAIQYATQQGNRSGRIANQFAKMIVGQEMLSAADLTV
ncbi:DUF815 domain-containing protein, partial [Acinetobacter baumannii]|uniref:DUF815 domain-containing protein n=1 Tax=Acinetobacter baumannii TaxID=470 RepID=UPI001D17610D